MPLRIFIQTIILESLACMPCQARACCLVKWLCQRTSCSKLITSSGGMLHQNLRSCHVISIVLHRKSFLHILVSHWLRCFTFVKTNVMGIRTQSNQIKLTLTCSNWKAKTCYDNDAARGFRIVFQFRSKWFIE